MRRTGWMCAFYGLLASLTGCGLVGSSSESSTPTGTGVAIVDLDVVATQVGRDTEMAQALEQAEASLNSQLQTLQAKAQEKYDESRTKAGITEETDAATITDDQKIQLVSLQRQLNGALTQAQQEARNKLNVRKAQLIQQFRTQVKPIAEAVAKEQGCAIVLTKNDSVVFSHTDAVDITSEVAQRYRASVPAAPAAPAAKPAPAAAAPTPPTAAAPATDATTR